MPRPCCAARIDWVMSDSGIRPVRRARVPCIVRIGLICAYRRARIAVHAVLILLGCNAAPDHRECVGQSSKPLYGATPDVPPGLPLLESQIATVGALQSSMAHHDCTALLIAERWVLSARHCDSSPGAYFRSAHDIAPRRVVRRHDHPDRDLALFELEKDLGVEGGVIRLRREPLNDNWLHRTVFLAGLGSREDEAVGQLTFVQEPIAELTEQHVTVDGGDTSGACSGDSGGPLFAVREDGTVESIGVLSIGSSDCLGLDRYERVDTAVGWLEAVRAAATADPCGNLDWVGACESNGPRWCATGQIQGQTCNKGEVCGWSLQAGGFRCVPEAEDPCAGVGSRGRCEDDVISYCNQGALRRTDCGACGLTCTRVADENLLCGARP